MIEGLEGQKVAAPVSSIMVRNHRDGRTEGGAQHMSEALYRKYRPQTFEDVVGQTHIERTLKNAIESDKVSHAYLFCGPRGTGKTTTARLLAKALLCEKGPTPSPDGTCEQCRAIAEGTHPDVNEMDAASRTGVENVREEIIGRVQYAPTRGRYKIYIIDEVHMLSMAAFNALLKTLEEPPDHVVFILCTTDPQKVPETIHSRCQRFDFHRLSNEEIVSRLGAVCVAEGVEFEGDALDLVAHRAQGGMRDALTTLEQLIAFGGGKVTVKVARDVLGSLDVDDMTTIVDAIAARDAAACFTWVSEYIETGADLAQFTRDLAAYVRDLYVLELTDGAAAVDAPASSRGAMTAEAKRFGPDRLAYILRVLGDLNTELRSSTNARLSFEIALTRMVRPESDLTLESLAARIEALEERMANGAPAANRSAASGGMPDVRAAAHAESSAGASSSVGRQGAAPAGFGIPDANGGPARPAPSPSIPPASTGYKSPVTEAPQPSAASNAETAAAAMSKAAAFRAQMEQRRAGHAAASTPQTEPSKAPAAAFAAAQPAPMASAGHAAASTSGASGMPGAAARAAAPSASGAGVSQEGGACASAQPGAPSASEGNASDSLKAKLLNPAALQRGWQAALAELKRQRAVYAALMQSARVVADADGSGVAVEFSKENDFAFSAAQKPDVSAALGAALQHAFGEPVPFKFTQGGGMAAAVMAAAAATGGGQSPVGQEAAGSFGSAPTPSFSRLAPSRSNSTPPFDRAPAGSKQAAGGQTGASSSAGAAADSPAGFAAPAYPAYDEDVVPYSDADAASYAEGDGYGMAAPWDDSAPATASVPAAPAASATPLDTPPAARPNPSAAANRPAQSEQRAAEPMHATHEPAADGPENNAGFALDVTGPAPVDPYPLGKKLGFDSMPSPKKRSKGTVLAKGWPGVGDVGPVVSAEDRGGQTGQAGASSGPAAQRADDQGQEVGAGAQAPSPAPASAARPFVPFDPDAAVDPNKPNPFAGRKMPSGIGQGGAKPSSFPAARPAQQGADGGMDIADIFGAFGVSMDNVQEE